MVKNYDDEMYWVDNPLFMKKKFKPVRKCTICDKPLPENRFFNHDECVQGQDSDETFLAETYVFHSTK